MDWSNLAAQAGLVVLKEGVSFVFSLFKDQRKAEEAEEELGAKAQKEGSTAPQPASPVRWDKVATLFWLGNDLMWIKDMTYRGADPARVVIGVKNAMEYAADLGFPTNSLALQNLALSLDILESLVGLSMANEGHRRLIEGHYQTIQKYAETVKWYVDALAQQKEKGFQKRR